MENRSSRQHLCVRERESACAVVAFPPQINSRVDRGIIQIARETRSRALPVRTAARCSVALFVLRLGGIKLPGCAAQATRNKR